MKEKLHGKFPSANGGSVERLVRPRRRIVTNLRQKDEDMHKRITGRARSQCPLAQRAAAARNIRDAARWANDQSLRCAHLWRAGLWNTSCNHSWPRAEQATKDCEQLSWCAKRPNDQAEAPAE